MLIQNTRIHGPLLTLLIAVTSTSLLTASDAQPAQGVDSGEADVKAWAADPERVDALSKRRNEFNYREEAVPDFELPGVLADVDGTVAKTAKQWSGVVRPRILDQFRTNVYGHRPQVSYQLEVSSADDETKMFDETAIGRELVFRIRREGQAFDFPVRLILPVQRAGRVPLVVFINNRSSVSIQEAATETNTFWDARQIVNRGYATASFHTSDVDPDDAKKYEQGIRSFLASDVEPGPSSWGSLSAWGFAASLVLDHLENDPGIDVSRSAVVGHSRGGKAALWAAAEDERFAIAYSNNSGCGGAALSRRQFGETVGRITSVFPHWFCKQFAGFAQNVTQLPVDQHQLVAAIAPRSVYVASADADLWADPHGEYLSLVHAAPVFRLHGLDSISQEQMPALDQPRRVGSTGYHIRGGVHNLLGSDWQRFLNFVETQFSG